MVTQINGLAGSNIGFKMTGEITKDDYDKVILPVIKKSADKHKELNLLMVIKTDLSKFTPGAWLKDAAFGLKNLTTFNHVALVSDSDIIKKVCAIANMILPGEYKYFPLAQEEEAREWAIEE